MNIIPADERALNIANAREQARAKVRAHIDRVKNMDAIPVEWWTEEDESAGINLRSTHAFTGKS